MNDYAGLLSADERARLEARLAERERATGAQMAIAVFRSLEGEDVADVANRLFQKWRLGQKGLDTGLLLVVGVQERKLRIEVGYGLEPVVTDALASRVIREVVAPRFREQRYAQGLEGAVDALYAQVAAPRGDGERMRREADSFRQSQRRHENTANLYLILFLALAAAIVAGLAWEASRQRHGLTAGRGGVNRTSGGWGGGYIGGGGWSGGGGGFSGGGGDSGGGGASGDW